ncbi:DUF456 domain-containing protein [Solitalea lacus]|uniref:DUF456 domain-containing protein n=1 Tax=Solitalea lacus TaxID=2911172 RepID=UPI001EDC3CBC|nr:DUF456 domain-containing protein [Solitalea lacus]UKJ09134.1 DUF456 domain-containing protein [Solitalea lacus]
MDILLIALGLVCIIGGFLGSFLPVLPGPPLSWLGLLFLHFTDRVEYSDKFLIFTAVIVLVVSILDYYIPVWGTKRSGGTPYGQRGAAVGLLVGVFLGPLGIILGPFVGAILGELIHDTSDWQKALKSGLGSFAGFIAGTAMKMIVSIIFAFYFIKDWFAASF